jgi:predicted translin family RNA/ssDNA-binding protein
MNDEDKLSGSLAKIFNEFTEFAQADQDIRDQIKLKVRELEQGIREAIAILAKIHHCDGLANLTDLLASVDNLLDTRIKTGIVALSTVIPKGQYFRFHNHFNYSLQKLVFIVTLIHFLRHDKLTFLNETAARLDMTHDQEQRDEKLYLDFEDYLAGVIHLSNELSRFTVNCVTNGDLKRPMQISAFLQEVLEGFRLLNLKNDNLRKKFDSIKYDMKKVEEVVYDLSIRGLLVKQPKEAKGAGDK